MCWQFLLYNLRLIFKIISLSLENWAYSIQTGPENSLVLISNHGSLAPLLRHSISVSSYFIVLPTNPLYTTPLLLTTVTFLTFSFFWVSVTSFPGLSRLDSSCMGLSNVGRGSPFKKAGIRPFSWRKLKPMLSMLRLNLSRSIFSK